MANVSKKVSVAVKADTRQAVQQMRSLRGEVKALNKRIGAMGKAMDTALKFGAAGAAIGTLGQLASKANELARESIKVKAVMGALSIGIGDARKASGGLITDMELATKANEAMRLGVVKTGKQFGELVGVATKLGQSVGLDASSAMDSLTTALARQSPLLLDNLGIQLKVGEANEEYAARLGKSVSALTDAERAEAFRVIGMERAREASKGLRVETDGLAGSIAGLATEAENFGDRLLGADGNIGQVRENISGLTLGQKEAIIAFREGRGSFEDYEAALNSAGVAAWDMKGINEALKISLRDVGTEAERATTALREVESLQRRLTETEAGILASEAEAEKQAQIEFQSQMRNAGRRKRKRGGGRSRGSGRTEGDEILAGQLFFAEQNAQARAADEARLKHQEEILERDKAHAKEMADAHKKSLADRIAAQEEYEAKLTASIDRVTEANVRGIGGAVAAAAMAKEDRAQAFKEEIKSFAGARATELGIQATMHFVKAAAFGAALMPVKAIAEASAGGIAAAGSAGMAATYGVASAIGGKGGVGSKSAEGPGNAFNLGGGSGGGGRADPSAPVSPLEEPLGASNPQGASSGGAAVINFNGAILDGEKLMRTIQDYERENGRILA